MQILTLSKNGKLAPAIWLISCNYKTVSKWMWELFIYVKKKKQIKMVLVFKAHPFLALSLSLGLLYFL